MESKYISHYGSVEVQSACREVQKWFEAEEILWRQHSKVLWLQAEDQNTSYFHNQASQRHREINIHRIKDQEGQ